MKSIHRSATKEQQILVEEAERRGIERGIEMSIHLLEAHGHSMGAQRLREAKIVEAGEAANGEGRT
jgi:uncharacterized protein GlcG (DUF336 family)